MDFKSLIFSLVLITLVGCANAGDSLDAQEILSIAKFTGACGILSAMSQFQNATQMEGGNEFIQRFWSTEAARLGKTPDQYIADCKKYIIAYQKLWAASSESER